MITEIVGDLFTSPETFSLVHCVSEDLAMGAGIARIQGRLRLPLPL